jgi:hypothetical protein
MAQHEYLGILGPVPAPTQHQQVDDKSDETVEARHPLILVDARRADQTRARNPRSTHRMSIRHPQVLTAIGRLHLDGIEFVLKQIGYRFASGSLRNAINRSDYLRWEHGWWSHPSGEDAQRHLGRELEVVPDGRKAEFDEIINRLHRDGSRALIKRQRVLAESPRTLSRLASIDWADG